MPRIRDVCRRVRSKNAGPFWLTFDFFFDGADAFDRYAESPTLGAELFARLYGVDPQQVSRFAVPSLQVLKVSIPRAHPQGWRGERDMHGGQFFARLLDVEIA